MSVYLSNSVEETERIGAQLARNLQGGECIALRGDLGAGKTQFVRGLLAGMGGDRRAVSSPTYVLLHIYDSGRLKLFHFDAYRITGPEDFEAIGFGEVLEQNGVVVVEWPERITSLLPQSRLDISITSTGETSREIRIDRVGETSDA